MSTSISQKRRSRRTGIEVDDAHSFLSSLSCELTGLWRRDTGCNHEIGLAQKMDVTGARWRHIKM